MKNNNDDSPGPQGELVLSTPALPRDTNAYGNIYAGWIVSQMDLAAAATAEKITRSRVVTVAIDSMNFVSPVKVGSKIELYTQILEVGRSSIQILVDVWAHRYNEDASRKVTEAVFVVVAVDETGRAQTVQKD